MGVLEVMALERWMVQGKHGIGQKTMRTKFSRTYVQVVIIKNKKRISTLDIDNLAPAHSVL